ncbi:MAG: hypothetical protein E6G00_09270 [Actinobacteria bacterium]|nr:MAG: hypothetical protein E6G00_09270 [Actinomycetota bacterium]
MEAGQATKARRTPEVLPLSQVLGSPLRDNEGGRIGLLAAVTVAVTSSLSIALVLVTILGL